MGAIDAAPIKVRKPLYKAATRLLEDVGSQALEQQPLCRPETWPQRPQQEEERVSSLRGTDSEPEPEPELGPDSGGGMRSVAYSVAEMMHGIFAAEVKTTRLEDIEAIAAFIGLVQNGPPGGPDDAGGAGR
eukprot:COSAG06_NODE_4096_length_4579_cov_2.390625_2_plen_131_part_00